MCERGVRSEEGWAVRSVSRVGGAGVGSGEWGESRECE